MANIVVLASALLVRLRKLTDCWDSGGFLERGWISQALLSSVWYEITKGDVKRAAILSASVVEARDPQVRHRKSRPGALVAQKLESRR